MELIDRLGGPMVVTLGSLAALLAYGVGIRTSVVLHNACLRRAGRTDALRVPPVDFTVLVALAAVVVHALLAVGIVVVFVGTSLFSRTPLQEIDVLAMAALGVPAWFAAMTLVLRVTLSTTFGRGFRLTCWFAGQAAVVAGLALIACSAL